MKQNLFKLLLLSAVSFSLLLCSCDREIFLEGKPDNLNGGADRDNNYEEYGSIISYNPYSDVIKTDGDTSGSIVTPLPLSSRKLAIATLNGSLVVETDGYIDWSARVDSVATVAAAMCADPEQNIYMIFSNGTLYSYSKDGKFRWKAAVNDTIKSGILYSDLLAQNDGIVVGSDNGRLAKYSFTGKVLWKINFPLSITSAFASDEKGNIALPLTHNEFGASDTLAFINKDGKILWQKMLGNIRLIRTPVINNGLIILPVIFDNGQNRSSMVSAFDMNGNLKWQTDMPYTARFVSADKEGRIYVTGYNAGMGRGLSGIHCLGHDGKIIWKQYLDVTIPSPIMVGQKNLAFVGVTTDALGVHYLDKNGTLQRTVSLSNTRILNLQPTVKPDRAIILSMTERLGVLRIDESFFDKMLPF